MELYRVGAGACVGSAAVTATLMLLDISSKGSAIMTLVFVAVAVAGLISAASTRRKA